MGELWARELADDLVDEWHDSEEDDGPLWEHMRLTRTEYRHWVESSELPDDFERRHD